MSLGFLRGRPKETCCRSNRESHFDSSRRATADGLASVGSRRDYRHRPEKFQKLLSLPDLGSGSHLLEKLVAGWLWCVVEARPDPRHPGIPRKDLCRRGGWATPPGGLSLVEFVTKSYSSSTIAQSTGVWVGAPFGVT